MQNEVNSLGTLSVLENVINSIAAAIEKLTIKGVEMEKIKRIKQNIFII